MNAIEIRWTPPRAKHGSLSIYYVGVVPPPLGGLFHKSYTVPFCCAFPRAFRIEGSERTNAREKRPASGSSEDSAPALSFQLTLVKCGNCKSAGIVPPTGGGEIWILPINKGLS